MKNYVKFLVIIIIPLMCFGQNQIKFEYDNLGRLRKQINSNGITITYNYNELGNRINKKVVKSKTDVIKLSDNKLTVFPNPVKDILYVNMDMGQNINYSIYSTLGVKVAEGNFNANNFYINVSNLVKGTYILQVTLSEKTHNNLFIKE